MQRLGPQQLGDAFDRHGAVLVLYARQWVGRSEAEDLVQDVFVRLAGQNPAPTHVRAWLFRSVRNAALNALRSQLRRRQHEGASARRGESLFEPDPEALIEAGTAEAALRSLPDAQREVVVLRIWAGMTLEEISELLDRPVSTLWSRYQTGLSELRARLEATCRTKQS